MNRNPSYKHYIEYELVCLKSNVAEVLYALKKEGLNYDDTLSILTDYVIPLSMSAVVKAVELRYAQRHKKLSYIDCLGYATAQEHKIPFLTGDKEFKDMKGVEFVN